MPIGGDPALSDQVWGLGDSAVCTFHCSSSAPGDSTLVLGTFSTGKESGPASLKQASSGVHGIGMAGQALGLLCSSYSSADPGAAPGLA